METSILLPSMISICFLMLLMNQDSHRTAAQMLGISQPAAHIPFEYRSDTVVHIISAFMHLFCIHTCGIAINC